MRNELLNELENLLEVMNENVTATSTITEKGIELLKRLRIYELYQEEQSQYDYCINHIVTSK